MQKNYLGCRSEATFSRVEALRRSADRPTAQDFLVEKMLSGECVWLRAGTAVKIIRPAKNPLYIVIMPTAETVTFVTYREFVQADQL